MKKIISLIGGMLLAANCFATGDYPVNSPQSGVQAYTGALQTNTITFSPQFTTVPIVQVFGSVTNASPITTTVTVSNVVIVVSSTNLSVAWNAYIGYPRLQYGSVANVGGTSTNITFPVPYAFPPTVNVEGSATNVFAIAAVTAITTTNFTILSGTTQTNSWSSIGTAYQPGASTVTY